MQDYINIVNQAWVHRLEIENDKQKLLKIKQILIKIIKALGNGEVKVCEKYNEKWLVNDWLKKAIVMYFQFNKSEFYSKGYMHWYDKIALKFSSNTSLKEFQSNNHRIVPGALIREGSYIGKNTVIMPSFINIGAYISDRVLIDTWATIGSCAYIGKNCHISGGVGIGGVLEPLQNTPVIIEDNCFIGARSEIVEGVLVEEGAVIGMGVFISASTKIINRNTGEVSYGKIPRYSVVVPGTTKTDRKGKANLYCAVIIKQVDESTRRKTSINEILRE